MFSLLSFQFCQYLHENAMYLRPIEHTFRNFQWKSEGRRAHNSGKNISFYLSELYLNVFFLILTTGI